MRDWAASGDFTAEGLARRAAHVAEVNGRVVGWAALIPRGDVCWLDDLWIEPSSIGTGIGSRLFQHAARVAEKLGASRMEWEAEPNALGFYERMGGRYLRDSEPSEWGRGPQGNGSRSCPLARPARVSQLDRVYSESSRTRSQPSCSERSSPFRGRKRRTRGASS